MKPITILKRLTQRFGLRGKDIKYVWEKPSETEGRRYYTEAELAQKETNKIKKRLKEDFRLELFNMKRKKRRAEAEEDVVFGHKTPVMKPFDLVNVTELYKIPSNNLVNELANTKKNYMEGLVPPYKRIDLKIKGIIDSLVELRQQIESNLEQTNDEYVFREKLFADEKIRTEMSELKSALKQLNFKYLPTFLLYLRQEIGYNCEYISDLHMYKLVENIIEENFHAYTTEELCLIFYAITTKMPKVCSIELRKRIRVKLAETDFNTLPVTSLLLVYNAFKNDFNNQKIHNKCIDYLFKNVNRVRDGLKENPNLAAQVLYTFANCRRMDRYRKFYIENDEVEREALKVSHLYLPMIMDNMNKLTKDDFLRLITSFYILKLNDYGEFYSEFEYYFTENISLFSNFEKCQVLYYFANGNGGRGMANPSFWKEIVDKHLLTNINPEELDTLSLCNLVNSLVTAKAVSSDRFNQVFKQSLTKVLEGNHLSYKEIALLSTPLAYLDMLSNSNEVYLKNLLRIASFMDEWVPMTYYTDIKPLMHYIMQAKPAWNLAYLENLSYHAEKKFSTYKLREKYITEDYNDIVTIVNKLDTYLLNFMDYKNLFLIDFCIEERKLAIMYLTERDYIYNEEDGKKVLSAATEVKLETLKKDEFVVCSIDHEEFMAITENKTDWLKGKLEEAFKLTENKAIEIHVETQKEIMMRVSRILRKELEDVRFPDLKEKLIIFDKMHKELEAEIEDANK